MDDIHYSSLANARQISADTGYECSNEASTYNTCPSIVSPHSIPFSALNYQRKASNGNLVSSIVDTIEHTIGIDGPPEKKIRTSKVIVSKSAKLLHYDGLRGLAAIWVFFIHYLSGTSKPLLDVLLGFQNWSASVPLFFILSGRVLSVSILRSGNNKQLASAIIRRPFRLLIPMIILAFIDMFILHVSLLLADLAQHGFIERYKSWRYSSYATAAFFFISMVASFRFSLFNIADTLDETIRSYQFYRGNMGVDGPFYTENALIFTFCFASMFAIETSAWLQRFFSWSLFTFLGRISFPLYLIHQYTFPYLDVFNRHVKENISQTIVASTIIVVIPTILVCIIAYLFVFIIDEPSVKFGRWVEHVVLNDEWSWSAIQLWVVDLPRRVKLDISQRIFSLRGDIMRVRYGYTSPTP
ncbi:hypothetical protein BASA50_001877 [Batrachochytrium salamandrivorans]|uniref:Acyltransferase 3 domain-containing protein n=1 Tax=Batrachochytrium salamandrivorans TaxID=1357716 RepID=A0ABQ8FN14_9FUNG|nr:hypothetical protein BASA61_005315 [Batrachochytrium salamandrivorans]KAH6601050.1 hypothetical protein BASA50_001877 [Batrachochytrium salamandrivorans]